MANALRMFSFFSDVETRYCIVVAHEISLLKRLIREKGEKSGRREKRPKKLGRREKIGKKYGDKKFYCQFLSPQKSISLQLH